MAVHVLSAVHALIAAIALVCAVQLLQPIPTSDRSPSKNPGAQPFQSPTPQIIQKPAAPRFIQEFSAYDFNTGSQTIHVNNTASNSFTSLTVSNVLARPLATPFLLTAIEFAALAFCYGLQWLVKSVKAKKYSGLSVTTTQSSEITGFLILLAPLMTLCSAALFAVWAPSVQPNAGGAASLSLYLLLQSVCLVAFTKLTPVLIHMFVNPATSNLVTVIVALVSGIGLNAFSLTTGFDFSSVKPGLLLLCACLSPIGPWVNGTALAIRNTHPKINALQAMCASLFALVVSYMTENVTCTNGSTRSLVLFAGISVLASGSRILLPATSPILPVKMLRDQLSLVLAWILGFTDSSSTIVKIAFMTLVTAIILLPRLGWASPGLGEKSIHYIKVISDSDTKDHGPNTMPTKATYFLFSAISLMAMGVGFFEVAHPSLKYQLTPANFSGSKAVPSSSLKNSADVPYSAADLYNPFVSKFGGELRHQRTRIPDGMVAHGIISVLLNVDPNHPPVKVAQKKKARPFALKAGDPSHIDERTTVYEVPLPPKESIPGRKWDPIKNAAIPDHARDLSLDHLRIGVAGTPGYFTRSLFSGNSWGQDPRVHWRTFWVGEDEPNGMTGEKSFIMEAFKLMIGHYPIIIKGKPDAWFSLHVRWFKMIPYMYQAAPDTTRWFLCGDDDSTFYVDTLFNYLRSIPEDPLTTSLYIGNIGEQILFNDIYGRESAYGGAGVLMSRHLAKRIHDRWQLCIDEFPDNFLGDVMMRDCVPFVTKNDGLGEVHIRKVPLFNQIDMFGQSHTGREYLSALFSRVSPITIHHHYQIPNLFVGMYDTELALIDFWHLTYKIPSALRFRRFFIHFKDGRTAVVTHGLQVRLYRKPLESLDHNVDYDSNITRDPMYVGIPWLLDTAPEEYDPSKKPVKRFDYVDYWLMHLKNNTLIYANDGFTDEFHLGCKVGDQSVPSLCTESL